VPVADRVHEAAGVNAPPLVSELNVTVPPGVVCPVVAVSATVAVQVVLPATTMVLGVQVTLVVVGSCSTVPHVLVWGARPADAVSSTCVPSAPSPMASTKTRPALAPAGGLDEYVYEALRYGASGFVLKMTLRNS
jgi:hypothetical protein